MQSTSQKKSRRQPRRQRKGDSSEANQASAMQSLAHRLDVLSKLPPPTTGPKLYKEGEGGTLQQVGREADNAWAGVKRIMALLNVEGKAFDTQNSFTSTYAGQLLNLSNISQGVGDNQRTGDSCKITRIRVHFKAVYASGNVLCQVVLGRSKDAIPAIADVVETLGTGYSGCSFENHDQRKADQWLAHRTFAIDVTKPTVHLEMDASKLNVDTLYSNATTSSTSGTYWLAVWCDNVSGPVVTIMTRADFVDN